MIIDRECEFFCVLGYVMCFCVFKNDGEIDLDLGFFPHISTNRFGSGFFSAH